MRSIYCNSSFADKTPPCYSVIIFARADKTTLDSAGANDSDLILEDLPYTITPDPLTICMPLSEFLKSVELTDTICIETKKNGINVTVPYFVVHGKIYWYEVTANKNELLCILKVLPYSNAWAAINDDLRRILTPRVKVIVAPKTE